MMSKRETARMLRKLQTPAEKLLWDAIKNRKLSGLKFRRQYPIRSYILDFYCPEFRLAVEIDGGIHILQKDYDEYRQRELEDTGIIFIRFSNDDVIFNLEKVLEKISKDLIP